MVKSPELSDVTDRANCFIEMTKRRNGGGQSKPLHTGSHWGEGGREGERRRRGGGGRKKKLWKKRRIMSPPMIQGRPHQLENNCWVGEGRGEQALMIDLSLIIILIACIQIPWVWFVHLARACVCLWVCSCMHVCLCMCSHMCVCVFVCVGNVSAYGVKLQCF